ncbi:MAG: DUF4340 domain-containing protein [Bdellovibrionales bacterium]|nr:DUF4340 domain-containing protein [Bdellovibrionales bacterium]
MKGFRATWAMSALVVVLAGYTYYEYRNASRDLDRAQGERQAFTLKREDINEIRLSSKGESTLLRKEGDDWKVIEPVADLAEGTAIEGFLFQTLPIKLKTFRGEEDGPPNFAEYGLEIPDSSIELATKDAREKLDVSAKHAFDGSFYVRSNGEALLGDAGLAQIVGRPPSNFRSRRLWRNDEAAVERVDVSFDGGRDKYTLQMTNGKWDLEPKSAFQVDSEKVEKWIEKVQNLLPNDFEKEGLTAEEKSKYLLAKPATVVTFKYKGKDGKLAEWQMTLGQDRAEDVFVYTDQRPTIYKTSKVSTAGIKVPPQFFREGKAPFQFDVEKAREVRVTVAKESHLFKKTDKGWELAEGASKDLELDQEKLVQLFQNVRNLEAQEFVPGATVKAAPQVEIHGDGGQVLLALAWGDQYKAKSPWNGASTFRFVKTNLGKEVMGMAADKLDKLVDAHLLVNKSSSTPEKK